MLEHSCALGGNGRLQIVFYLLVSEQRRFDEGHGFIDNRIVAGNVHIKRRHVWQPQEIIRKSSAYAATGGRVPPVQHVALFELAGGRAQDLCARNLRARINQRHDILQLIAEAKGAA